MSRSCNLYLRKKIHKEKNRETKGTAGPLRSGYSADLHALNRWVKTSHIHSTLREAMKKRFRLNTSSTHKELTFRNKKHHHDHVKKLKKHLVDYNVDPDVLVQGQCRILPTGKRLISISFKDC